MDAAGGEGRRDDARRRWNTRHADRARAEGDAPPPSRVLTARADLLPRRGRALDVAGGTGRNALWLAGRGLRVTLVDVSDTAVAVAAARAAAAGRDLEVVRADLAVDAVPPGPYAVLVVHHWLDRDVWRELPGHLGPEGLAVFCQPTTTNLERHARPPRRFLLDPGEMAAFGAEVTRADATLEVVEHAEGWTEEDRHEALLVLRRRATS